VVWGREGVAVARSAGPALECQQGVARLFDRAGDGALLLGGEVRVFAREDFAGVGDVAVHQLGRGEGELLGRETLLLGGLRFFGGAHGCVSVN